VSWPPGASDEEIESLQRDVTMALPFGVKETYLLFNGSDNHWVLGLGYLASLDQVRQIRQMYLDNRQKGQLTSDSHARPPNTIRKMWWNPMWIPILDTAGGSVYCVDLDPTEFGIVGQFIRFSIEEGPIEVLANSFEDYVCRFAEELEKGQYYFDSEEATIKRKSG